MLGPFSIAISALQEKKASLCIFRALVCFARDVFIPRHTTVTGYYGFTLDARVSVRLSVRISFPDDNEIFTKFVLCIYIVEIWFWIADGQISSNFDGVICLRQAHIFICG